MLSTKKKTKEVLLKLAIGLRRVSITEVDTGKVLTHARTPDFLGMICALKINVRFAGKNEE
jgi:hypothetical protein